MKTYVTFGQSHVHTINGKLFDKDCVAVIKCTGYDHGRKLANCYFGGKFCSQYMDVDKVGMIFYPRGLIEVN